MPIPPPSSREDFKITIICALTLEAKAVIQIFDAIYDENLEQYRKAPGDNNTYTLGSIGKYHVVLVYMPGAGRAYASSAATNVKRSYANLELALVVGVCGGVPYTRSKTFPQDIYLGDVIISKGVVQYDLGRLHPTGFVRKNTALANLPRPGPEILSFLNKLDVRSEQLVNRSATYLAQVQKKFPSDYPGAMKDRLFSPDYAHQERNCKCAKYTHDRGVVARRGDPARNGQGTVVHFGLVASGDTVMMSAHNRDQISEIEDIIGFEMEGAGVWENLPCIVIKGVSDYADSHKTKEWQHFAAACAAACTRAILDETPVYLPNPLVGQSNIDHSQGMPVASCRKRPAAEISESGYEDDFYIESLTFPQAQYRLEEISSAHEKTCEWIRGRPEYLKWMSEESLPSHGGFFWIKGKPGAGKSTIMKYLFLNTKKGLRDTVILSFFFHAQGTLLERSVMGMYRSLLHQLLCSTVPADAKNTFLNVAKRLELQDGNLVWTKRDVKNLLSLTIKSLQKHHILFLIDAVDECDQAEVEDMATFFQELGNSAVGHKVYLRICLASRHYPHITLDKGIELIVEDQQEHEEDLKEYVATKLKGGRSNLIQGIRDNICQRADGVFLWVMLVVRSLNEAFDRGNIGALQKRLNEIPDGLDNLFTDILTRDQKDIHVLIFSLQLILFGRRTLRRDELYFAVLFEKTNVIEAYIDPELHSTTVMDRLLLDVTKGLAETAEQGSRAMPPDVRFIHESVRDFLLRRNGLAIIQSQRNDSMSFIGVSHDCLKQFCFDYISGVLQSCQLCPGRKSLMLRDTLQGEGKDGSIPRTFPFLDYAIRNILKHSDLAQAEDISQNEFLSAYSSRFSDFKHVFNAVETIPLRHYRDDWSLVYEMAHRDLSHLIQVQLLGKPHACDLGGQYLCPMGIAFRNGNMTSVRALLGLQPNPQSQSSNIAPEPELVSRMKRFFIEFEGQTNQSKPKSEKSQRLLSFALKGKCVSILRLLLFTNIFDFNDNLVKDTLGYSKKTPLSWSILNREPGLVDFLVSEAKINIQAHINKSDSIKKPLLRAAFRSNDALSSSSSQSSLMNWRVADRRILGILLRQDSLHLNCQDNNGMNAVHWAALADDAFSLKCLIKRGLDYEHCDSTGRDPLSYAAEYAHVNIVETLLEIEGIEVDRRDQSGRTPLTWAVAGEGQYITGPHKSVFRLWTNRSDFNARYENFQSPLASAVRGRSTGGVEALLNFNSIDVNTRDLDGRTPLIMAAIYGDTTIIEYLLRCDRVDVDAQDNDGRTALSWVIGPLNFPCTIKGCVSASYEEFGSYIDIAKLLLASRTPDIDLADIWGHTPAWWEKAYKIALAELGGTRYQKKLTARPSLQSLLEDSHSPPGVAALAQYMDLETIKSEMRQFLDGEAVLKSRVRFDLEYQNVKFGTDSVFEGTEIKTSFRCSLD